MAGLTLRQGRIVAGPLEVKIECDGKGRLHRVEIPTRIPHGLAASHLASVIDQLARHELATAGAPPFHRRTWKKLRNIPWGETLSYGRIAEALGRPGAGRAVGQACAANRLALIIPCHRVVGATGPGGFAWGAAWKAKLLSLESSGAAHPRKRRPTRPPPRALRTG